MAQLKFHYKARDHSGIAVSGIVEAENQRAVSESLKKLGYQIISVEKSSGFSDFLGGIKQRFQKTRPVDIVFFSRQLNMMVRAGLPLIDAIHGVAEQATSLPFRKTLSLLVEDLKGGASFSDALSRHPNFFSNFYVSMVKAGETAGILEQVLERLATIGEEDLALRGRVKSAMAYPVLLVLMSLGIVSFLLIVILPKFVGIFEEAGAELPLPTVILLTVSMILKKFWYVIPIAVTVGTIFIRRYIKTPAGRYKLHGWLLKMPLFGPLMQKTILARFCRTMGALLKSGIQAVTALTITAEVVDNEVFRRSLMHIREAVVGGSSLADPFRTSQVFPSTLVQMVGVGEQTGSLDELLLRVSDYYDQEVDRYLRALTSIIEPGLLLVMGGIVGFIALSVLLPVFQLVQVFKK
jgi:type IV pilus assembly protein PilC